MLKRVKGRKRVIRGTGREREARVLKRVKGRERESSEGQRGREEERKQEC